MLSVQYIPADYILHASRFTKSREQRAPAACRAVIISLRQSLGNSELELRPKTLQYSLQYILQKKNTGDFFYYFEIWIGCNYRYYILYSKYNEIWVILVSEPCLTLSIISHHRLYYFDPREIFQLYKISQLDKSIVMFLLKISLIDFRFSLDLRIDAVLYLDTINVVSKQSLKCERR